LAQVVSGSHKEEKQAIEKSIQAFNDIPSHIIYSLNIEWRIEVQRETVPYFTLYL
jgi:hypothetical protein